MSASPLRTSRCQDATGSRAGARVEAEAVNESAPRGLLDSLSLEGRVAVVTGATGAIGSELARGFAAAHAQVALLARSGQRLQVLAAELETAGGASLALPTDVLDESQLRSARGAILNRWGRIDILVNCAGGPMPAATVPEGGSVFDLPLQAVRDVVDLNLFGTLLPILVFGREMGNVDPTPLCSSGSIVNISSMAAGPALTRVIGYSAAKASVENLTRWLAVQLATEGRRPIRVNAVAPGFLIGEQNRSLLLNPDASLTARGQRIIDHTPAKRFAAPHELVSAVVWLSSESASFVTGIIVAVDGGFSAFSGV